MKKNAKKKLKVLKILTFKIIFLVSINTFFSQNILKGEILNAETSIPVSYASIEFLGTNRGIIADYNGQFSIPVNKIRNFITVKISSIGYTPIEVRLDSLLIAELNILKLQPKVEELNSVVLKVSKKRRKNFPQLEL